MAIPALSVQVNGGPPVSGDNYNTYVQGGNSTVTTLRGFIGFGGMNVFICGYSTPGDGGQGTFYWNVNGTGPDDDGVTNIVPNGSASGCWTRIGLAPSSSATGLIQCLASGTNIIALIPIGTIVSSYSNYQQFGFVVPNTTTGLIEINVNNVGNRNVYLSDGATQAGSGDFKAGMFVEVVFSSSFNSGAGGFQIVSAGSSEVNIPSLSAGSISPTSSVVPANGLYLPGTNTLGMAAEGAPVAEFAGSASAVNYFVLFNAATAVNPILTAAGSDTNISLMLESKGVGDVYLGTQNGGIQFAISNTASAVDFVNITGGATGNPGTVIVAASGTDTNINLELSPKGTGTVQFGNTGSFSTNASVATSLGSVGPTGSHTTVQKWLTIKDSSGNPFYIPCF